MVLPFILGKDKFLREWNERLASVSSFSDKLFVYMHEGEKCVMKHCAKN